MTAPRRLLLLASSWSLLAAACDPLPGRAPGSGDGPDRDATWWQPAPGTSWQWQLTETIDTTVEAQAYDVDLFEAPDDVLSALHEQGRTVICYFSAGTHEDRRGDADAFPAAAIGNALPDWPGERWLDVRDDGVRAALAARLDHAQARGCDAVEPDNVDGYANDPGFDFDAGDQQAFNRWLADEAHARGLSVGLKNDLEQVAALEPAFDWALDEECMAFDECDALQPFIDAGKAVFHVEYVDDAADADARADEVCDDANGRGFSSLIKTWDLNAFRRPC
ncbi:MAG: endo alpha-1,4 polygalactosaminidase [Nannocystaceae bacterium]